MRFALVIPALNEEEAIATTLRRALAARAKVVATTLVSEMTIVFVNDGSTDRTQEIVDRREFDEVVKVRFAQNQGYGAAIMTGWKAVDAELLGFIDADGTCDPDYCIPLIECLTRTNADVVLASRLSPQSKMPKIRRLGNIFFAKILGAVSHTKLTDCASGFRIVKKTSLRLISPLPRGLHFTPAMSAICLLDPRLRIEEVPMPYEERIGRSKLSVIRDGLRFLYTILFTICCYSPIRTMFAIAGIWSSFIAALMALLVITGHREAAPYLALGGVIVSMLTIITGAINHQLNYLMIGPRRDWGSAERTLQRILEYKALIITGITMLIASLASLMIAAFANLGLNSFLLFATVFLMALGAAMTLAGVIVRLIWAVGEKQKALTSEPIASYAAHDIDHFEPSICTIPTTAQESVPSIAR